MHLSPHPSQRLCTRRPHPLCALGYALYHTHSEPSLRALTAAQLARQSDAAEVVRLLQKHGTQRIEVPIASIVVSGAGDVRVDGEYSATSATTVPVGFGMVHCAWGLGPYAAQKPRRWR